MYVDFINAQNVMWSFLYSYCSKLANQKWHVAELKAHEQTSQSEAACSRPPTKLKADEQTSQSETPCSRPPTELKPDEQTSQSLFYVCCK